MAKTNPPAIVPVDERTALIQVIERAAANPDVDISKMERLLEMHQKIVASQARTAFISALAQMQPELPVIAERGSIMNTSGKVQSTYALWEDLNEQIRPFLSKYGFALSFRFGTEAGSIEVTGVLSHREGHSEETTIRLPVDASGSKNAVQAVASSTSYGKRYTATALLNLTSRFEDDDGQGGAPATINEEQAADIGNLIMLTGSDKAAFLAYLSKAGKVSISEIKDLPANMYKDAQALLARKQAAKAKKEAVNG